MVRLFVAVADKSWFEVLAMRKEWIEPDENVGFPRSRLEIVENIFYPLTEINAVDKISFIYMAISLFEIKGALYGGCTLGQNLLQ